MSHKKHHSRFHPSTGMQVTAMILTALLVVSYHFATTPQTLHFKLPSSSYVEKLTPTPPPHATAASPEINKINPINNQVAFTFDAGSGHGSAPGILAALAKHHVKGTFFFTGKWVEQNPELAKQIKAAGHEIFNHSYSHPYFTQLTATEIADELNKMDDLIYQTAGVHTRPYFRPPYGDRDDAVLKAAGDDGFQSIYWSVDSLDWREGETVDSVKNRVLDNIHPGAIVLMHIGDTPTGDVLDEIFTTLENKGYKLVSLTEGLQGL